MFKPAPTLDLFFLALENSPEERARRAAAKLESDRETYCEWFAELRTVRAERGVETTKRDVAEYVFGAGCDLSKLTPADWLFALGEMIDAEFDAVPDPKLVLV